MVPSVLVGGPIEEGRALIERLDAAGFPVKGAYWLYDAERGRAWLYIVSPVVDQAGPREAYARIRAAHSELGERSPWLDYISVLRTSDPFVQALKRYVRTPERARNLRLAGENVANVLIDDMYIYRLD